MEMILWHCVNTCDFWMSPDMWVTCAESLWMYVAAYLEWLVLFFCWSRGLQAFRQCTSFSTVTFVFVLYFILKIIYSCKWNEIFFCANGYFEDFYQFKSLWWVVAWQLHGRTCTRGRWENQSGSIPEMGESTSVSCACHSACENNVPAEPRCGTCCQRTKTRASTGVVEKIIRFPDQMITSALGGFSF